MSKLKDKILEFISKLRGKPEILQLPENINQENYNQYKSTYDTLTKLFKDSEVPNIYLIGGISSAIQTNQDLYRQNSDIDIMCNEENLQQLIQLLNQAGYKVQDKREAKTGNRIDKDGNFIPMDHELNADTKQNGLLGVGIFTYKAEGENVITQSFAFDEREGCVIGTKKIMPKELFDLMYESKSVNYKGIDLKSQSKEYIYLSKSKGKREKDKIDAEIIEPSLDDESRKKIKRIQELELKTYQLQQKYDEKGNIISSRRILSTEEKGFAYLDKLFMESTTQMPSEVVEQLYESDEYKKIKSEHPEIDGIIEQWKEKSKNYDVRTKLDLITQKYSDKLTTFSKKSIDNVLDFLHQRRKNHGRNISDINLSLEAKEIMSLMNEFSERIKHIWVDNNINLTHISSVSPDKLDNGVLRKSVDKPNNYETERVNCVFASSSPIDGNNPYIARSESGMVRLDEKVYIWCRYYRFCCR